MGREMSGCFNNMIIILKCVGMYLEELYFVVQFYDKFWLRIMELESKIFCLLVCGVRCYQFFKLEEYIYKKIMFR